MNEAPMDPDGFATIHCGAKHNLALTIKGEVLAWGRNQEGQVRSTSVLP
jgi:alpha-tubulin suppressor-like RCC1 family protein